MVTSENTCVRVWNLETQSLVHRFADFDDFAKIAISADTKVLICYLVGVNIMRAYSLETCEIIKESRLERDENTGIIDREKILLISATTYGEQLLVAYQDDSQAITQNYKSGAVVYTLKCAEESSRITALAVSKEYFACGYQFKYLKQEMPYAVDIFATGGGAYVRTLRGCNEDNITHLMINSMGSHALCASTSEATWSSDLAVWNLETEEHKHLASHAGVAHVAAVESLTYFVTSCKGEHTLRVWNLSGAIIKPAMKVGTDTGLRYNYQEKLNIFSTGPILN